MLRVTIPGSEFYDESKEEFLVTKSQDLTLEHSLLSVSKWESKWKESFFNKKELTRQQTIDYIRCMTITPNVDPLIYRNIPQDVIDQIVEYINDPMTATWFPEEKGRAPSREIITSEIVYYWMIAQNIPLEWEKRHLNRLLTLIHVCSIKNAPPKKMSRKDQMAQQRALNAARRAKHKSKG